MLGLKRGTVKLVDHNPKWLTAFKNEKKQLQNIFGADLLGIEHIGSTSIPGIKAKPIMDLMIAVSNIGDYENYVEGLSKLGYQFMRDNRDTQEHILFVKGSEEKRTHYLKLCELNSDFWNEHLIFRNYLINHPDKAKEYERLKIDLNKKYSDDRDSYTKKKANYIKNILKLASK